MIAPFVEDLAIELYSAAQARGKPASASDLLGSSATRPASSVTVPVEIARQNSHPRPELTLSAGLAGP